MFDLIYSSNDMLYVSIARLMFFFVGALVSIHFVCSANFLRQAPFVVKGILLPIAVGSGISMLLGSITGKLDMCFLGASSAAFSMICLDISAWYSGVKVGDVYHRRADIQKGIVHEYSITAAPFEMPDEIKKALLKLKKALVIFSFIMALGLITDYPNQFFTALMDNVSAIGFHEVKVNTETVQPNGKLVVTWNVERTRVCKTGLRTWIVDAKGTEHLLDLKVNNPPVNIVPEPGIIHSYQKEYTIPENIAEGRAYITASVWHACNPVRSFLQIYKFVYYERAYFNIEKP